jgi:hypothetical protein
MRLGWEVPAALLAGLIVSLFSARICRSAISMERQVESMGTGRVKVMEDGKPGSGFVVNELLEGFRIDEVPAAGFYVADFISEDEEKKLLDKVKSNSNIIYPTLLSKSWKSILYIPTVQSPTAKLID